LTISVCIICFNEEPSIKRCLESVAWADEIVVVDSMSRDRTLDIARQFTRSVHQRKWTGYADQKNYALSLASGEWVLSLDADEEATVELSREIIDIANSKEALEGYLIPRRSFYQGRWIKHSGFYPDRQLRFFRRNKALWTGKRVHEKVHVEGRVGFMKGEILHYPYGGILEGQLATVNSFSTLMALDLHEQGKRFHLILLLLRPFFKFLEVYFLRLGLLDGIPGLIISVTSAYAMFARYVKLRELEQGLAKRSSL
jgi:glycosyltransferase involved in cell wall biosynthesis